MNDPIEDIENAHAWLCFGRQGYLIYKGAKDEGASGQQALAIVRAFYAGMLKGASDSE